MNGETPMPAHINIHYVHKIGARAGGTSGAPLIISASNRDGIALPDEVTLFTDDHDLSSKLADVINATVAAHRKAHAEAVAAAAA
jgi:hypothetical protein